MQGRLNICDAPYHADPTGRQDCTQAIIRALDDITELTRLAFRHGEAEVMALPATGVHYHPGGVENRREHGEAKVIFCAQLPFVPAIYFPEGTYRVSDTLIYGRRDLVNHFGSDLNQQIRIRGAGVGRTFIRLADASPGFGEGARKPVIAFMPGARSNVSMSNYCEDLTILCGAGNPGAVGLDFFANNSGAVRNVRVISEDGAGYAGILIGHDAFSGILVKHVEVDGFDHGVHIHSASGAMFAHIEDIVTSNQRCSGVTVGAISVSIRKLRTRNVPTGLTCTDPVGFTALVDSELEGSGPKAIDRQAGHLYVSNVETRGFDDAGDGGYAQEWAHPGMAGLTRRNGMNRLPIEETPVWDPTGGSTGIRAFGAAGNGIIDDSPAIQRALDSGAAEICFEPGRYLMNSAVVIPSHVEHIDFGFCDLVAGVDLRQSDSEGFVIAGHAVDRPLFVERLFGWEQWSGEHCTFTHASRRTVCFKDMHTQTLKLYRNTVPGAKVFFDNVAITTGVIPGTIGHGRCAVSLKGQTVWARQLNPERGEPMILNDGGDLVLMGYKSEGTGAVVHTINAGRTEVIGGVINIGKTGEVAFVAEDSQQRISTASQGWREPAFHRIAVKEIQNGEEHCIPSHAMPSRGFDPSRGPQYVIPLYCTPGLLNENEIGLQA